jgi:hypothetical protein
MDLWMGLGSDLRKAALTRRSWRPEFPGRRGVGNEKKIGKGIPKPKKKE